MDLVEPDDLLGNKNWNMDLDENSTEMIDVVFQDNRRVYGSTSGKNSWVILATFTGNSTSLRCCETRKASDTPPGTRMLRCYEDACFTLGCQIACNLQIHQPSINNEKSWMPLETNDRVFTCVTTAEWAAASGATLLPNANPMNDANRRDPSDRDDDRHGRSRDRSGPSSHRGVSLVSNGRKKQQRKVEVRAGEIVVDGSTTTWG